MSQLSEILSHTPLNAQWNQIGNKPHHGINLPLSALHTKNSCGIGEFYDLIPMIDWCAKIGMDVIQLLPLNDSADDPSPFFIVSALALNPLFLSLHKLENANKKKLEELKHLNALPRVAYHDVQSHKLLFLYSYFEEVAPHILTQASFKEYIANNPWVESYALFKALKEVTAKNHWQTWPVEMQNLTQKQFEALTQKHFRKVCFYIFIQYLCYQQLFEVKAYANAKGVFLKGDLPLFVSPDSADVWQYTEEFDLTLSAGAPPDQYNAEGQVWGLPIIKWDTMRQGGFAWWKERLKYASNFYDIYRMDHVLGFFRIWAIPHNMPSEKGKFIPSDEALWLKHGSDILQTLSDTTSMLPIAEDLGIVSPSIKQVLCNLGICGTKVIRWEKFDVNGKQFIDPLHYQPISMTTVSTHDSETLEIWWRENPHEAKPYALYKGWDYGGTLTKAQRREILWDSHHSSSVFHINLIGEYLALFPELVWDNPHDERINVPGVVANTNWTYRIRPSVEELVSFIPLQEEIKSLL